MTLESARCRMAAATAFIVLLGCAMRDRPASTNTVRLHRVTDPRMPDFYRIPAGLPEPIPAVRYGQWFVPAWWVQDLAKAFDQMDAFRRESPEFCAALWVNASTRMVHASIPVSFPERMVEARRLCPALAGVEIGGAYTVGTAHQHQASTCGFHPQSRFLDECSQWMCMFRETAPMDG